MASNGLGADVRANDDTGGNDEDGPGRARSRVSQACTRCRSRVWDAIPLVVSQLIII